jgi:hypothetical protein
VLVAGVALAPVYITNTQDVSRLCLTRALTHGHVVVGPCIQHSTDRAERAGRLYSDKAPGISVLALPASELVGLPSASHLNRKGDLKLWAVRLSVSGVAFLLCALLVGRVSEGLAPGRGGAAMVAFALGTLVAPLAATLFDQVTAATLGFGAFLLAWGGRPYLAGLAAGSAVVVEYEAGMVGCVLALYLIAIGVGPFSRYVVGAAPPLALLAMYNWAAFGSPFHLSYHYSAGVFEGEHTSGIFGIGLPQLKSTYEVFAGHGGLLVISPIVFAAAGGLFILARRHRAEAIVCAAVALLFVLMDCGYHDAYGGTSPGPRYLIPALPFLAVGLGPAFARMPRLTALLAAASVVAMSAVTYTWQRNPYYRETIWGEIARVPSQLGSSWLADNLVRTPLAWLVPNRLAATPVVALMALAALAVALNDCWRARKQLPA